MTRKFNKDTLWQVLCVILSITFLASGLIKVASVAKAVEEFDQIGLGQWFRYFTGGLEIAGAIGLMVHKFRLRSAITLVIVMFGAVITNIALLSRSPYLPAALLFLLLLVAYHEYGMMRRIAIQRVWAFLIGVGFIIVGILRFIPIPNVSDLRIPEPIHGSLHLVSGLTFIWGSISQGGKFANWVICVNGIFWTILGAACLLNIFKIEATLQYNDNWIHLVVGILSVIIGWGIPRIKKIS